MSTPAQKPRPSARRITARVALSRPARVIVSASSNQPATSSALTGGASITTSAMPWSCVSLIAMAIQFLIHRQIVATYPLSLQAAKR